jgi:hypothetical protein
MQPMGRLSMHSNCLEFFSFKFWGVRGRGGNISFPFVPNGFPSFSMCSARVFPIAPLFNHEWFAQCPLLLTCIGGPKGEALHLSIESSILGSLHSLNFFLCDGPIKLAHCQKKKVGLVRHPQLINMKQN